MKKSLIKNQYLFLRKIIGRVYSFYYFKIKKYKNINKKRMNLDYFKEENIVRQKLPKNIWPNGHKSAFVLEFDDFCTKSKKTAEYDYGGDPDSGICLEFEEFLRKNPKVKATIFTIPNAKFIGKNYYNHKTYPENEFLITTPQHKKWLSWIKSKEFKERNEIAVHGLYHLQMEKKNFLPFCEFEFKDEKQSKEAIQKSLYIFKKAALKPVGFKPPTWAIGHNSGFDFIKALKKSKFKYVCLSSPVSGLNWEKKTISNIFPQKYENMLNIPQNINMNWPIEEIKEKIDEIIRLNGIITPQLHFNEEDNWMSDGIGKRNLAKLQEIIDYINEKYDNQVWFAKCNEVAKWWKRNNG